MKKTNRLEILVYTTGVRHILNSDSTMFQYFSQYKIIETIMFYGIHVTVVFSPFL